MKSIFNLFLSCLPFVVAIIGKLQNERLLLVKSNNLVSKCLYVLIALGITTCVEYYLIPVNRGGVALVFFMVSSVMWRGC